MAEIGQRGTPTLIRAALLGETRISVGTRWITDEDWPRRNARNLLLLLLATPGHRLPRDRVLDLLWPETEPKRATNALYVALHGLRRVLEPNLDTGRSSAYIESGPEVIGLRDGANISLDIDAFEAGLASAASTSGKERRVHLRKALALYNGDLLLNEPYADWAAAPRERLRRRYRRAVLDLADLDVKASEPEAVVPLLEQLLDVERTDEVTLRTLMRTLAAAGEPDEAIGWFHRGIAALRDELGVEPEDTTRELADEIRASVSPPAILLPPTVVIRPRTKVPVPPNALIGRVREVEDLQDLILGRDVRLVTVTGPGGVGKTRLVLETARHIADDFADGACFVALATIRDPSRVVSTISQALGLAESGKHSADEIVQAALGDRELLLVLDNFERVIEAAPRIAALLEGCGRLKVLITSREPLRVRAEHELPLPPLEIPKPARLGRRHVLARYESVELFVERAHAVRPSFMLTDENALVVAELCARLDGLPLAIELAAAQVRAMSPAQLLAGMNDRFTLLAGAYRDLPARQQTLRDAITWSYDLLSPPQRSLFRELAVFAGSFSNEAAVSVVKHLATRNGEANGDPRSEAPVGYEIASLVDRGLLRRLDQDAETRFSMLETIREYGLDELSAHGEEDAAKDAHAHWFLALAERATPALTGPDQVAWFDRLEIDLDNIRAALEWTLDQPKAEHALKLASALRRFWLARGYLVEGREWLERALARGEDADPATRAKAMFAAGALAFFLGDSCRATALAEEGLSICRSLGDSRGIADALLGLGHLTRQTGDLDGAAMYLTEGIAVADAADDRTNRSLLQEAMGKVFVDQGDLDRAEALFSEVLRHYQLTGGQRGTASILTALGDVARRRGDVEQAIGLVEDALVIVRRLRDAYAISAVLLELTSLIVKRGDHARAVRLVREGLALAWEHRLTAIAAACLRALASLAAAMEQPERSAWFYGATEAFCRSVGVPMPDARDDLIEGSEDRVRAALGEARYAAAWSVGHALTAEQAIAEALDMVAV
jgi:predicted ATPase/DNA-binding SARP family transcriptional activator